MERIHESVGYVALGDSMSIDDYAGGPGRGAASLLWRNRDDDFPAWAGRDLTARDPTARLALLASDGATSATVAGEQLGRLHRLERTPTLATVTMGGNDLLAAYGDATAARRAIRTVVDNGRLVLGSLRSLMGSQAPIVVATVYDPSDGSGDAGRLGLPPWPEALELLAELNRALRMLAEHHQALVADVHARFLGHGLAAGDPTQSAARPSDRGLWYCDLIEPNAWGASAIRAAFWATLERSDTEQA
jgi:lysophospholipase L1-like esterase